MNHKRFITLLMFSLGENGLPEPGYGRQITDPQTGLIYSTVRPNIRDYQNFSGIIAGHDEQIAFKVRDGQIELRGTENL